MLNFVFYLRFPGLEIKPDNEQRKEGVSVNRKQALRNLEEAVILLREVEGAVLDGQLEAGLEFEKNFTEAVNEIERLQADLTEDNSED
jgi:methylphosphotriester-DNA--protein-cysteine methyltransferase